MKSDNKQEKVIIGRVERVNFMTFGLKQLEAKIDTGAYSSAIHCQEVYEKKKKLYLKLVDHKHKENEIYQLVTSEYSETIVKSSNGERQKRYKIKTSIKLGDQIIETDFTLADREEMKYPVLLGRKAIGKKFLVDVSKKFILSKKRTK